MNVKSSFHQGNRYMHFSVSLTSNNLRTSHLILKFECLGWPTSRPFLSCELLTSCAHPWIVGLVDSVCFLQSMD